MNNFAQLGKDGEAFAEKQLISQGYKIVAKNFVSKGGEIDLICQKNEVLAFVEVKTRQKQNFLSSALISPAKQKKICRASKDFLVKNRISFDSFVFRFDNALVLKQDNGSFLMTHQLNAFLINLKNDYYN